MASPSKLGSNPDNSVLWKKKKNLPLMSVKKVNTKEKRGRRHK